MARRRFLQPGYWTNPTLSKCPALTRLLFQVIWNHADYDGCFRWDPEGLAMKGLPRDDFEPGEALDRLKRDGFVQSYQVDGNHFGFVVNWHKHQDPHPGERPVCPKPQDDSTLVVKVKDNKWRKPGDTAFGSPETKPGLYLWLQLVRNLPARCREVAGKLSATDKEGQEGQERQSVGNAIAEAVPTPTPSRARVKGPVALGDYPEEMLQGVGEYRALMNLCRTDVILNKFPKEHHKYVAKSLGANAATWKAWQNHLGSPVHGVRITNPDILEALLLMIDLKRKNAEEGTQLAVPGLPALLSKDLFIDALVKVMEVAHAS